MHSKFLNELDRILDFIRSRQAVSCRRLAQADEEERGVSNIFLPLPDPINLIGLPAVSSKKCRSGFIA